MRRTTITFLVSLAPVQALAAQSNTVPGLDGNLFDISQPRIWGRRGPAHPGGEIGFSARNDMCNSGTVIIPWSAAMQANHPKFGFMIVRESGGRMEQISDWSYIKHAFLSLNTNSGPCLPCLIPGSSNQMEIGCSDVYSNGNNGDRFWLGPPEELNPWLGTWNPVGSYFDRGDPAVAPPANMDGVRSLTSTQTNAFDVVKNRVTVRESDLLVAGATYYFQIHLIHQGEALVERNNNLRSRGVSWAWNGTAWNTPGTVGSSVNGSVLTRWTGASYNAAANGTDDGQFGVAVKVTGPVGGFWHYEYAVQNIDNNRGGSAFRLPVCAGARVQNAGFRDIDQNALNDWTTSVQSNEIAWLAAAGNSQRWNQLFNFWFDCDVAPVAGSATIDQANPGPGALTLTVPTQVPGLQPAVHLGGGCGTPAAEISVNGLPTPGNAAFALNINSAPATPVVVYLSPNSANTNLAPGCDLKLDLGPAATLGVFVTDGSGAASAGIPLPAGLTPIDLYFQGGSLIPSPPLFGLFGLTNGLKVRFAGTGCN